MSVTKENIEQARQTNLAAYLSSKGEQLVKNGRRFKHKDHDSLVFTDNMYFWNSRQEFGNALDYAIRNLNMDFQDAVKDLCNFSGVHVNVSDPVYNYQSYENVEFKINDIPMSKDSKRVIAYLTKTRGLDFKMVVDLIRDKLIAQTRDKANIAFLMKDEKGNYVGIEYNTTLSEGRFKGIQKGSNAGYGFNILNCKPDDVRNFFFTESAIDLLSFRQMKKIPDNSIIVSMAGLKEGVIRNTLDKFGSGIDKEQKLIYMCVDSDQPGINFCMGLKKKYENMKFLVPSSAKDWNAMIKKKSIQGILLNINNSRVADSRTGLGIQKMQKVQLER